MVILVLRSWSTDVALFTTNSLIFGNLELCLLSEVIKARSPVCSQRPLLLSSVMNDPWKESWMLLFFPDGSFKKMELHKTLKYPFTQKLYR